jgi:regulator of sigma E protease
MVVAIAIIALGVLIVIHEGGHFLVARLCGMRVDRFSIGFGPAIWKKKIGETQYQIAAIPLGGFVQIAGLNPGEEGIAPDDPRSYVNRPAWQRFAAILAGPATNYLFALLLITFTFLVFGVAVAQPTVGKLEPNKPAALAGLKVGDEIRAINGVAVYKHEQVPELIGASQGKPIPIEVLRDGATLTITVTPQLIDGQYRIGVAMGQREGWGKPPVGERLLAALYFPIERTQMILGGLVRVKSVDEFSGPVGIVGAMKSQIVLGVNYALWVVAVISVALGLFNLLPLPALDGGRLIFLLWEMISRRRVNLRVEQAVHTVGMFALLGFVVYVTFANDLFKKKDRDPSAASNNRPAAAETDKGAAPAK